MCVVCERFARGRGAGAMVFGPHNGAIAQVVERLHGMEKAQGSSPCSSTLRPGWDPWAVAGFVAGEGCFTRSPSGKTFPDGSPGVKFVFTIQVAAHDRGLLEAVRAAIGSGSISADRPPARPGWQPTVRFDVRSHRAHRRHTIPFMEAHLLPSHKRQQFEAWRDDLAAYEGAHPTRWGEGPSSCSILGCERPVRGRGLCRSHYHQVTGW